MSDSSPIGSMTFGSLRELAGILASSPELQETAAGQVRRLSASEIEILLNSLPRLTETEIRILGHHDSLCPVCFTPFSALIAEEESALAMDSPAHPVENLGITKLSEPWQCGHLFCRRDISQWIRDGHDSCPTCRRPLVKDRPSSSSSPSSNVNVNPASNAGADFQTLPGSRLWRDIYDPERVFTSHSRDSYSGMYS